jgi:hypothetical protein
LIIGFDAAAGQIGPASADLKGAHYRRNRPPEKNLRQIIPGKAMGGGTKRLLTRAAAVLFIASTATAAWGQPTLKTMISATPGRPVWRVPWVTRAWRRRESGWRSVSLFAVAQAPASRYAGDGLLQERLAADAVPLVEKIDRVATLANMQDLWNPTEKDKPCTNIFSIP